MRNFHSWLLRCCVLLACLCVGLPAFAHGDDEPAAPVDRRITKTSNALAGGALGLMLVAGGYVFLVKRGIIKSKSNDRWE